MDIATQAETDHYWLAIKAQLHMARIYRQGGQRAAAARALTNAQASGRLLMGKEIVEWIVPARRYDGSVNAFATRYLP